MNENFWPKGCPFKTCKAAMEAFETEAKRNEQGNAFKEYFGDVSLFEVGQRAYDYVDWLLEKYERKRQTISKKVYAGSSLFQWMKRKGYWAGENPLHGVLHGIKFAPDQKEKSIIEPNELQRLRAAMQFRRENPTGHALEDPFKELRIITEVLFYTGMRVSEALGLEAENIDSERLCLQYLRTKRKNKHPDWRRIPIPPQLVVFLINEGRTEGKIVRVGHSGLRRQLNSVKEISQVDVRMKTFRKDFAFRARQAGASKDDVNLYQGRDESVLEHHYTTDEWFIYHQCRPWIEKMYSVAQPQHLKAVN